MREDEFLRLFGYKSLNDMPELPKLKEEDGQINLEEFNSDETTEETAQLNDTSENIMEEIKGE